MLHLYASGLPLKLVAEQLGIALLDGPRVPRPHPRRSTSRSAAPRRPRSTCCVARWRTASCPGSTATAGMPAAEWRVARLATAPHGPRSRRAPGRDGRRGRAVGLFGLVFGAQTLPVAIDQSSALIEGAGAALMAVLYGAMAALAVASIAKVAVRAAALTFARPLPGRAGGLAVRVVADPAAIEGQTPWLYYICTVATTAAVVALSVPLADGIHDPRAGRSTASSGCCPPAARPCRCWPSSTPSTRSSSAAWYSSSSRCCGRRPSPSTARRRPRSSATTLAVRQHATEVERVQGRRDRARQRADDAALGGGGRLARGGGARRAHGAERDRSTSTRPAPTARVRSRRSACPCSSGGCAAALTHLLRAVRRALVDAGARRAARRGRRGAVLRGRAGDGEQPAARRRTGPQHRPWAADPRHRAGGCSSRSADDGVGLRSARRARRAARASGVDRWSASSNAGGAAEIVSRPGQGTDASADRRGRPAARGRAMRRDRRPPLAPARARGAVLALPRRPRHLHARRAALARGRPWSPWCSTRSRPSRACWPVRRVRMPDWLAAFDLAVCIVLPLLVTSQLDPDAEQRLRDLVRRRGGHAHDDHGGTAAAGGGVARRHRARRAERRLGRTGSRSARSA